jgi:hypothetical protein
MAATVRERVQDERGFVLSFAIKTMVIFALLGLIANEAGQIIATEIKGANVAADAAEAAADTYKGTSNYQKAFGKATEIVASEDSSASLVALTFDHDGAATVTIEKTAHTLIVSRIGALKHLGERHITETATRTSS